METGTLTPRSNDIVDEMRFSGGFGQPDGFGSVLTASMRKSGDAALTLVWRDLQGHEQTWSVVLAPGQKDALGQFLTRYQPRLYERITKTEPA